MESVETKPMAIYEKRRAGKWGGISWRRFSLLDILVWRNGFGFECIRKSFTKPWKTPSMLELIHLISTRKSSCVNARGIPTAAYQVLHLLSYPGGGTHPWWGGGGYPIPGQGGTHRWLGNIKSLVRGYPIPGIPILAWVGIPHPWPGGTPSLVSPSWPDWGTPRKKTWEVLWDGDVVPPRKDMGPVEVLWNWDGDGVPLRVRTDWKHNLPSHTRFKYI